MVRKSSTLLEEKKKAFFRISKKRMVQRGEAVV